jgi:hypothetical protein
LMVLGPKHWKSCRTAELNNLVADAGGTLQKKDGFVLCPQPRLNDPNDPLVSQHTQLRCFCND